MSDPVAPHSVEDQQHDESAAERESPSVVAAQAEENLDASAPAASGAPGWVYAVGRIEPRFPTLAVEKEFTQAAAWAGSTTSGLTDREAIHALLSQREHRYLARQICWVFTIEGVETYILHPRDPGDVELLCDSLRPAPRATDVDVVIGVLGPIAPPEACSGLVALIVVFDNLYSFDVDSLVKSIPRPEGRTAKEFATVAEEIFARVGQLADNAGATDDHRAVNYLAVRYPAIYHLAAEQFAGNASLASVYALPSRLSGTRNIVDVVFSYRNRETDVVADYFVRVDVTEEFPFLVTKLSPYFGRQ